jgi:hypothetical protein
MVSPAELARRQRRTVRSTCAGCRSQDARAAALHPKEDDGRDTLTLLPNRPTNKHGDGTHSIQVVGGIERHARPPRF